MSDSIVLFEPTRLVPSENWLASRLLVTNRIATLDPREIGQAVPARLDRLKDAGFWQEVKYPTDSASIGAVVAEVQENLANGWTKQGQPGKKQGQRDAWVYNEKLPGELQEWLLESNILARQGNGTLAETAGNTGAVKAVLDALGRRLVSEKQATARGGLNWVLDTDSREYVHDALVYDKSMTSAETEPDAFDVVEMRNLFPVLAAGIDLGAVIDFRQEHAPAFVAYQQGLAAVLDGDDPEDRAEQFGDAVREFTQGAFHRGIQLKLETRYVVRKIKESARRAVGPRELLSGGVFTVAMNGQAAFEYVDAVINPTPSGLIGLGLIAGATIHQLRKGSPTVFTSLAAYQRLIVPTT